jgi:hypothetical protein
MTEKARHSLFGMLIALLLALVTGAMLATAYTYGRSSGFFPKFIGWIFIGLVLIELSIQLKSFLAGRRKVTERSGNISREIRGFLWLGSLLTAVYLVGFLIATPLYIFSFLRISASKSVRECTVASVLGSAFVYVIFVVLLDYRLFAGVMLAT